MSEKKYVRYYGSYPVVDCEHEGDIEYAKHEVIDAGGIVEKVISTEGDNDYGDFYEDREWYIEFYCNSKEEFFNTCEKLGL